MKKGFKPSALVFRCLWRKIKYSSMTMSLFLPKTLPKKKGR
ncbi:MAG: hypothetical protein QXG93_00800 [Nitrososphaerota archaeon]